MSAPGSDGEKSGEREQGGNQPPRNTDQDATEASNQSIVPVQPQQAPAPVPSTPDLAALLAVMQHQTTVMQQQAAELAQFRADAAARQAAPAPTPPPNPSPAPPRSAASRPAKAGKKLACPPAMQGKQRSEFCRASRTRQEQLLMDWEREHRVRGQSTTRGRPNPRGQQQRGQQKGGQQRESQNARREKKLEVRSEASKASSTSPAVSAPTVSDPAVSAPVVPAPAVSAPTVSAPAVSAPTVSAPAVVDPIAAALFEERLHLERTSLRESARAMNMANTMNIVWNQHKFQNTVGVMPFSTPSPFSSIPDFSSFYPGSERPQTVLSLPAAATQPSQQPQQPQQQLALPAPSIEESTPPAQPTNRWRSATFDQEIARKAELDRVNRALVLSQQQTENLMLDIRRREQRSQLAEQVTAARNMANRFREALILQAEGVQNQHIGMLRQVEQTPVNSTSEAAFRAVHGVYHLAMIRGVFQHRQNLDADAAAIENMINSWTVGSAEVASTIQADFQTQASKRELELASLTNEAAQHRERLFEWVSNGGMPPDEWLYINNETPPPNAVARNTDQLPPIIFMNVNVHGQQSITRPVREVFPALPASRRVIELIEDVAIATRGRNAEEDGSSSTAVTRPAPTYDDHEMYD